MYMALSIGLKQPCAVSAEIAVLGVPSGDARNLTSDGAITGAIISNVKFRSIGVYFWRNVGTHCSLNFGSGQTINILLIP